MARKRKRKMTGMVRVGNWVSLFLVVGAVGAAGFVYWRWEYRERRFDRLIGEVAPRYGVDPLLVKAVMRRESKFDPFVYGSRGEIGLMQVTEGAGQAWARAVGRRDYGRSLLWDAEVNVEAGSWYLGRALGRWPGRGEEVRVALAVAEYNAGYGNVLRWMAAARGSGGTTINGTAIGGGGSGVSGALTEEEFVGAITYPAVRDYVREVVENYRMYKERGRL